MHSQADQPVKQVPGRKSLGEGLGDIVANGLLASHCAHAGGDYLPLHEHGAAYLCIVLAGGYSQTAGHEIECRRGSLVAHPAGHVHANRFGSRSTRCVNLYFDAGWLDDPSLARLLGDYGHVQFDPRDGALARLEHEVATRGAGSALGVASAALEITGRALRPAHRPAPPWLGRVCEAIASDPAQPPDLSALAKEAGVHPAHLCRSFRQATGETVGAFSRRLRLEAAHGLLAGRLSIAEVAAATGFYDQAHFARHFRRQFGLAPSARRAQLAS